MKAFICAAEILIRINTYSVDANHYNYQLDLHNVYPSCKDRESAYWKYGGDQPGVYISDTKLPFENGLYYWAVVTAECEQSDGGYQNGVQQIQWLCELKKVELIP